MANKSPYEELNELFIEFSKIDKDNNKAIIQTYIGDMFNCLLKIFSSKDKKAEFFVFDRYSENRYNDIMQTVISTYLAENKYLKYDVSKAASFSTYAVKSISNNIREEYSKLPKIEEVGLTIISKDENEDSAEYDNPEIYNTNRRSLSFANPENILINKETRETIKQNYLHAVAQIVNFKFPKNGEKKRLIFHYCFTENTSRLLIEGLIPVMKNKEVTVALDEEYWLYYMESPYPKEPISTKSKIQRPNGETLEVCWKEKSKKDAMVFLEARIPKSFSEDKRGTLLSDDVISDQRKNYMELTRDLFLKGLDISFETVSERQEPPNIGIEQ